MHHFGSTIWQLREASARFALQFCGSRTALDKQPFNQFTRAATTLSRLLSLFFATSEKMTASDSLTVPTLLHPIEWDDKSYQRLDLRLRGVKLGYPVKEVLGFVLNTAEKLSARRVI
jgi:hypothetical protein